MEFPEELKKRAKECKQGEKDGRYRVRDKKGKARGVDKQDGDAMRRENSVLQSFRSRTTEVHGVEACMC